MRHFPNSAEEFYALRDDRTNRCVGDRAYQKIECTVALSKNAADTLAGQVMFITSCNLLSRWCRTVKLSTPGVATHPALGLATRDLGQYVISQMRDADPFGDVQIVAGMTESQISLVIGAPDQLLTSAHSVYIDASGWFASIGLNATIPLTHVEDGNSLGAIAAACLGVAQVFKIALGLPSDRLFRGGIFDLFTLDWVENDTQPIPWPKDKDIGRVLMVGAGSVGSSAAYCMRLANLAGEITIADKDIVKIENFNRSPIFGCQTFLLPKSEAVANFLGQSPLAATPRPSWWNELAIRRADFDFDVWLPLANEFGVRFSMQNNIPPLMIYASTGANWGINHGRHIPSKDDCLADRFPAEDPPPELACATGEIITSEGTADAALPFCSLFAGLLITADLIRANLPEYPQVPNFAFFDWYGSFENIQMWNRRPRANCVCTQVSPALNERFNGRTRYWALSNNSNH